MSTYQKVHLDVEHPETQESTEVEVTYVYTQGYKGDWLVPPAEDDIEIVKIISPTGENITEAFTPDQIMNLEGRIFETEMC